MPRIDERMAEGWRALQSGELEAAEACYREALSRDPSCAEVHNNLGLAIRGRGDLDAAEACYRRAVELRPDFAEALHNLANARKARGDLAGALTLYDRAVAIARDVPPIRLSRALAWLASGNFERGWPEYEWRLKCPGYEVPGLPGDRWDGRPIDGQSILLHADHGLGDGLQFIRYASAVTDRGGRVIVQCREPIARLLATLEGVDLVVVEGAPIPPCDFHVPLMSLPGLLGTTAETIPADVPYLLADPDRVAAWADAFGPGAAWRVGVAWQGSPAHARDRERSFRLDRLSRIASRPDVRLYSLQKGPGREQIDGGLSIVDLADRLDDLMETAAAMENLDLVITADTAIAHLAGALGLPAWVALSFDPDWRWMPPGDGSAWYPSLRLFRQPRWGDWDDVFARMEQAIDQLDRSA